MQAKRLEPSARPVPLRRDRTVQFAAAAAVIQVAFVWLPFAPLGIPGEWVWQRVPYDGGGLAALFLGTLAAVPFGGAYLLACLFAGPDRATDERPRVGLRLVTLAAAGFAWLWAVQEAGPREYDRLGRAPIVLFHPSHSGYFTEARRIDDLPAYLASYESLMAQGDVLHIGTHPPGLTVAHRVLLDLFECSPELTRLVLGLRPASVRDVTEVVVESHRGDGPGSRAGGPPSAAEQAELWAATLLVQVGAAAAVIPLYHLASRTHSAEAAWRTACLWPLVPAVAVFLPKADALLPLFGLGVLALWYRPGPPGLRRAAAVGALFWLGLTISLAMLPVAVLCGALSLEQVIREPAASRQGSVVATLKAAIAVAAAFLSLTLLVRMLFGLDLLAVWSWNYRNHAAFYSQYDRTYRLWLLANPVELTLAVGAPVVAAFVANGRRKLTLPSVAAILCVVGVLWLSGKNSGEAARLWLFLMPWVVWLTADVWDDDGGGRRWIAVLLLQMAVGFATAVRVGGFGFDEFVKFSG